MLDSKNKIPASMKANGTVRQIDEPMQKVNTKDVSEMTETGSFGNR